MISNPYLPSPSAAQAWAEGFVKGFAGPQYSTEPPSHIAAADVPAYAEGALEGQNRAINGLNLSETCVPAAEEFGEYSEVVFGAIEIAYGLRHFKTALAGGLAGVMLGLLDLAIAGPSRTLPPEEVLPRLLQPIVDQLSAYGIESLELFCAAGIDATAQNCEILLSPMFRSMEQAKQSAIEMARDQWVIVSWRTDQSESFRIVESS